MAVSGTDMNVICLNGPRHVLNTGKKKINGNVHNDQKVVKTLRESDWRICIVWECAIKGAKKDINSVVNTISKWLTSDKAILEVSG